MTTTIDESQRTALTTLLVLKTGQIKPHKNNPRRDVGDVTELAASVKEKGIVEPLIVAPNGTGDTYILIAGHRRLAAAKQAKRETVPCIVRLDLIDPLEQLETMLVENLQRVDLSPMEEGEAYQQLLAFPGYTQKKITQTIGRSASTVRARIKLTTLPKSTRDKLHSGQITLDAANAFIEFATDKAAIKKLENDIGTRSFEYTLSSLRSQRKRDRKKDATRKALEDAGVRIVKYSWQTRVLRLHGQEIDQHRDCEGFAAYIEEYAGDPRYICDKPDLHGETAASRGPSIDEIRGRSPELAAAAVTRRAWLREMVSPLADDIAHSVMADKLARELSARLDETEPDDAWAFELCQVTVPPGEIHDLELMAAYREQLEIHSVTELVVLLDIVSNAGHDDTLLYEDDWGSRVGGYDSTKQWRERLVNLYGYEWTASELAAIEAATPKPAVVDVNLPADDVTPGGGE